MRDLYIGLALLAIYIQTISTHIYKKRHTTLPSGYRKNTNKPIPKADEMINSSYLVAISQSNKVIWFINLNSVVYGFCDRWLS